jgi:hypothetical protein
LTKAYIVLCGVEKRLPGWRYGTGRSAGFEGLQGFNASLYIPKPILFFDIGYPIFQFINGSDASSAFSGSKGSSGTL